MTSAPGVDGMPAPSRAAPATAGGRLKAARQAAGLSVDAVAQQLKLAPRQVTALEEDDWSRLPGRTFARGFARNYARFLQLDADEVLAMLPAPEAAPALERPALASSRRPMGDMPVERVARPSAARWLLPLLIIGLVAAAAYYELSHTQFRVLQTLRSRSPAATTASVAIPGGETAAVPSSSTPGTATSMLPNPVTAPAPEPTATAAVNAASGMAPPPATAASSPPVTPDAASATPPARAEAPLVLAFKGTSWVEVKDASGRIVVQMTGGAGMTQTVSASPPLELALGNAPDVVVTFRGQALDLAPYTRGGVARVALQ